MLVKYQQRLGGTRELRLLVPSWKAWGLGGGDSFDGSSANKLRSQSSGLTGGARGSPAATSLHYLFFQVVSSSQILIFFLTFLKTKNLFFLSPISELFA